MADLLQLDIVTPDRIAVSAQVEMVVAPGTEGVFGVMAYHAPFISSLKPGVIEIYEGNTITSRFAISGGYAEVSNNKCVIIAEQLVEPAQVDRIAAAEEARITSEQLKAASEIEMKSLEQAHAFAEAKLQIAA